MAHIRIIESKNTPDVDARLAELRDVLKERKYDDPVAAEQVFSTEILTGIAKVLSDKKFNIFGKYKKDALIEILDHVYHRDKLQGTASALIKIGQNREIEAKALEAACDDALTSLADKQDTRQQYHAPPHAMEMRDDCKQALKEILVEILKLPQFSELNINIEVLIELAASLAQQHDDTQLQDQFKNELMSADDYAVRFQDTLRTNVKALEDLARKIIIRGTMLSMHFVPGEESHNSLQSILVAIDEKVLNKTSYSAEEQLLHIIIFILSHFDVSSLHSKEQADMPDDLYAELKTAIVGRQEGLESKGELISEDEFKNFFPAFQVATGQHGRMMADGYESAREFKDGSLPQVNEAFFKARMRGLDRDSVHLKEELFSYIDHHLDAFKQGINLKKQLGFVSGMNSREALDGMRKVCPEAAAIFEKSFNPKIKGNAWETQKKFLLKLNAALEAAKEDAAKEGATKTSKESPARNRLIKLYCAIIYMSSNQRGLDLLAGKNQNALKKNLVNRFGMKADEIKPAEMKQYAIAYMSVILSADGNKLLKEKNVAELRKLFDEKMKFIQAQKQIVEKEKAAKVAAEEAKAAKKPALPSVSSVAVTGSVAMASPKPKQGANGSKLGAPSPKVLPLKSPVLGAGFFHPTGSATSRHARALSDAGRSQVLASTKTASAQKISPKVSSSGPASSAVSARSAAQAEDKRHNRSASDAADRTALKIVGKAALGLYSPIVGDSGVALPKAAAIPAKKTNR